MGPDWQMTLALALRSPMRIEARRLISGVPQAQGRDRGLLLVARAVIAYMDGPGYTTHGLRDLDEALSLLDDPSERFQAVLTALALCYAGQLPDRAEHYLRLMEAMSREYPVLTAPWHGRYLINRGQVQMLSGRLKQAIETLEEAVTWHRQNLGPFDAADQQCYLGLALLNEGYARVKAGDAKGAKARLAEAMQVMPVTDRAVSIHELAAQIALAEGDTTHAREHGEALLAAGGGAAAVGLEILARAALGEGDAQASRRWAETGLRLAAANGDWGRVVLLEGLVGKGGSI